MSHRVLSIGHSPDADDAFMFYAMTHGKIDCAGYEFRHQLEDIQTLNERALRGELEISAVSLHAYAHMTDRYALLACGASMGKGYGPMVVAREAKPREQLGDFLRTSTLAIPGTMTTAFLVLRLLAKHLGVTERNCRVLPFDRIMPAVSEGEVEAGLIIHEGQITYAEHDLHCLVDLGAWWLEETGLPLPLGVNVVLRDLGEATLRDVARIMRDSIDWALEHREEALNYALEYGRGMTTADGDRFVGMYVNDYTRDFGEEGRLAVTELLQHAYRAGLLPAMPDIEFVSGDP